MEKNIKYNEIVQQIKECGESLIGNAEIIAGGYKFQTGNLEINIVLNVEEAPLVKVNQKFIPIDFINRYVKAKQ